MIAVWDSEPARMTAFPTEATGVSAALATQERHPIALASLLPRGDASRTSVRSVRVILFPLSSVEE
ncbi:MAG: hypothetical protein PUP91_14525 [Rhizonema sp. PD37]|nr:hypothetical protein [Rhizonema sp. PD37]